MLKSTKREPDAVSSRAGPDVPQCVAHKKTGERCKRVPIIGSTVCQKHGGAAKQVKAKARQRLDEAADKIMAALIKIAMDESEPSYVRVVAMRDLLDRAGFGAKHAIAVTHRDSKWDDILDNIIDIEVDRDLELPPGEQDREEQRPTKFALEKLAEDATRDNFADLRKEEEAERDAARVRGDGHRVVEGEVVEPTPNPNGEGSTEDDSEPPPGAWRKYTPARQRETKQERLARQRAEREAARKRRERRGPEYRR